MYYFIILIGHRIMTTHYISRYKVNRGHLEFLSLDMFYR